MIHLKHSFYSCIALLIFAQSVAAIPVGYVKPEIGKFSIQGEHYYFPERLMVHSDNAQQKFDYQSRAWMARIGFGVSNRVEVFGRLGMTDLDARDKNNTLWGPGESIFGNSAVFGIGAQAILYDMGAVFSGRPLDRWNIAVSAQYLTHSAHDGVAQNGARAKTDFDEWDLDILVQGSFRKFQPYAGVGYSDAKVRTLDRAGVNRGKLEAEDIISIKIGAGVKFTPAVRGFFETRFVNNPDFSTGLRYSF